MHGQHSQASLEMSACHVKQWVHATADSHALPTIPCTVAGCALSCNVAARLTVERRVVGPAMRACCHCRLCYGELHQATRSRSDANPLPAC